MKAVTRDGRRIECDEVEERGQGVALLDDERGVVGYVPYRNFRYALSFRTPVASSSIRSVGYDDGVLEIEFHHGGVYQYFDVPGEVYRGVLEAGSRGRYFHDEIRGQYDFRRIS